jgi:C4-dicarboxylate transporter DctM subunit
MPIWVRRGFIGCGSCGLRLARPDPRPRARPRQAERRHRPCARQLAQELRSNLLEEFAVLIALVVVVLAILGVPMFVLFGGAALVLFLMRPDGAWASAAIDVFSANFAESPSLMTIPLFTFAGFVLAGSQAPIRLIRVSRAWIGWLPGGLAVVCLMASTFFATFTGGSGVTIVAVGGLLYPALLKEKYPEGFSIGMITTAGALGGMFPPSVLLIFYGIVAGLSIDKLLLAGILTGLLCTLALGVYAGYVGYKAKVPRQSFDLREALVSLWDFKWEAAIPIVLIGGFATGLMRFHEASAFTAFYVLVIEVFVYRDISIRKDLPDIIVESMAMLGAVLVIMVAAVGFTGWMVQAEVPTILFEFMDDHIHSQWAFLIALNLFLVAVGMFTDGVTAILLVVPLILPLAYAYHIDPYHLAVIFLLNLEIGFLIPPVGMNLFISAIRFGRPLGYVCMTVIPFVAILSIVLGVVSYVPWLSTYLPSFVAGEDLGVSLGGGYMKFDDEDEVPADEPADDGVVVPDDEAEDDAGVDDSVVGP